MGVEQVMTGQPRVRHARWRPAKAGLRWRAYLLLAFWDVMVLLFAHAAAGALRFGDAFALAAVKLAAAQILLFGFAGFAVNAYSVPVLLRPIESVRRGLKALAGALIAAVFLIFLLQFGTHVSRFTFAAAALFAAAGLIGSRWTITRNVAVWLGGEPYDVVVIADGPQAMASGGCTLFFDGSEGLDPGTQCASTFDRLGRLVEHADRVIIACPPERRAMWAAALQGANVQAEVVAPELAGLRPLGVAQHGGTPTMIVARAPFSTRDRMVKRGFDLVVAAGALVVVSPVVIAIALAVRLSDGGPVLFRQRRIGRHNLQFDVLKFRTMRVDDADQQGDRSTTRDDDRITPLGRLLRASSLDELPQLINVLRGEMSMVGPRPHAVGSRAADRLFWEVDVRYWHRHAIKPGVTGLAQVRGLRGATAREADLRDRLQADLEYQDNWSIWRDIAILLRTVPVLLHRNAY